MNRIDAKASKKAMSAAGKHEGYLNSFMAVESDDQWTATTDPNEFLRFARGFLYRKTVSPYLYGGFQIHRVLVGTRLADEWIAKVAK